MQDIRLKAQDLHQKLQVIEQRWNTRLRAEAKQLGISPPSNHVLRNKDYMRIADAMVHIGVCAREHPPEKDHAVRVQFAVYEPLAESIISENP